MMDFLYFPTDKSEYVPAFITLVIFMILAVATFYLFTKKSKKQEKEANEKYEDMYREAAKISKEAQQNKES